MPESIAPFRTRKLHIQKTFNFLRYLSLGKRFGIPPGQFFFFFIGEGTTIFTGEDMSSHPPPTLHTVTQ